MAHLLETHFAVFLALAMATVFVSCSPSSFESQATQTPELISEAQSQSEANILEIAKRAVHENEQTSANWEYHIMSDNADGWTVIATRLPHVFGGNRFIEMDSDGNVTEYSLGL